MSLPSKGHPGYAHSSLTSHYLSHNLLLVQMRAFQGLWLSLVQQSLPTTTPLRLEPALLLLQHPAIILLLPGHM